MAERITKTRECDRAMCRRRKGVRQYELVLRSTSSPGVTYDCVVATGHGELCPAHAVMVQTFMANLFKNTKQYDDPTSPIS